MTEPPRPNPLDVFIKYAGPLLAIATAGLSLYVALGMRETNKKLAETQAAASDLKFKSDRFDLEPRIVAELGAQNAAEFAATVRGQRLPLKVPDAALEKQLVEGKDDWAEKKHLMTGSAATGLYLRQIVYVKLTNLGKTSASDLKLVVRQKDFPLSLNGTQVKRYGELDTKGDGWVERTLDISADLMVPLAQVSGGEYYFGRVLVPVKLTWMDRKQGKPGELPVRVAQSAALDNLLMSAILGKSEDSNCKPKAVGTAKETS